MDSFRNKLKSILEKNPELRKKFKQCESIEDTYEIFKDYLETMSLEDFKDKVQVAMSDKKSTHKTSSKRELDLDEMQNVVGGMNLDVVGDVIWAEIKSWF